MIDRYNLDVCRSVCELLGIDMDDPATGIVKISMTATKLKITVEDGTVRPWVTRTHELLFDYEGNPSKTPPDMVRRV